MDYEHYPTFIAIISELQKTSQRTLGCELYRYLRSLMDQEIIYELKVAAIVNCKRQEQTLLAYFVRLKKLWDELDYYESIPNSRSDEVSECECSVELMKRKRGCINFLWGWMMEPLVGSAQTHWT